MSKEVVGQQAETKKQEEEDEEEEEENVPGSTLFIKNLNFITTEETLREVGSGFMGTRSGDEFRGADVIEGRVSEALVGLQKWVAVLHN